MYKDTIYRLLFENKLAMKTQSYTGLHASLHASGTARITARIMKTTTSSHKVFLPHKNLLQGNVFYDSMCHSHID